MPNENQMNLTEMKAAIEKLNASLAASDAKILALETTVATLTATNGELVTKLAALETNVTTTIGTITASTGETVAKLEGSIVALETKIKTADAKAIDIAARAGVPAVEDHSNDGAKSKADIHAEYNAISDPVKRGQFYAEHREMLLGK